MTLATAPGELWWYTARSSGVVAWAMLTGSVFWGLLLSTKLLGKRPKPSWVLDLHRFLGGAALVFTGLHLGSLALDSYVGFGPVELLVPFASAYRPSAVAWGVVALYLLLAVEITSLVRDKLPNRVWRRVHFLSFPLFVLATVHGLTAGTEDGSPLLNGAMVSALCGATVLTVYRVWQAWEPRPAALNV